MRLRAKRDLLMFSLWPDDSGRSACEEEASKGWANRMRRFPITQAFIDSNPRLRLNDPARPSLSRGQRTIIFECFEAAYPGVLTLSELVDACEKRRYRETLKGERSIERSILYHLNRIDAVEQI